MNALGWPFLFLLWAFGKSSSDLSTRAKPTARRRQAPPRRPPPLPASSRTPAAPRVRTQPPPWPQVVPQGLPPFPGSGWEPDEPPPRAVVARAGQLLSQLWKRGAGTFKIEQTDRRWIAYRATQMGSKKGVVAYRLKFPGAGKTAAAPTAQKLRLVEGQTYRLVFRTQRLNPAALEALRAHLATRYPDVKLLTSSASDSGGYGWITLEVTVLKSQWVTPSASSTMLGRPVLLSSVARKKTGAPPAAAPSAVPVSTTVRTPTGTVTSKSWTEMPTLRYGVGLKPAPPSGDVKVLQTRLGITADGRFGSGTRAAVRKYQQAHGLVVDGIVGTKTWTALFGVTV